MEDGAHDRFRWFFGALPVFVAVAALAYFSTRTPPSAPSNATVFGCYVAAGGPPILLDGAGMHVLQAGFPTIPFHLERLKTGITLTAEAPIRADKAANGYRFGIEERGIGYFMDFYRVENGRTYGVFDESLLEGFRMLASDGIYLSYSPTDAFKCA